MSIVTLKKKTNQKYNSMSVGRTGFSLNGTHRNQGFVGQNLISRSLPTTKMGGNTARGHGGSLGKYHTPPNIVSGIQYQNDPTFIKSSVLSTNGMIMTKYRWIRRPHSFATVKSNSTNHINNQSDLINRKRLSAATDPIINTGVNVSILPLPFTSSICGVCNLSGNGTQNGIYKVAQSSGIGYNAFNGSTTGWKSASNYSLASGTYTGSSTITVQTLGVISGEWLKLQIPSTLGQLFTLTKYSISPIVSEFNTGGGYDLNFDSSPSEWYVLGSIDGIKWIAVDHQAVDTYWSDQHLLGKPVLPLTFSINNSSVGYVYYTIIFRSNSALTGTYPNNTPFNTSYVGIQNFTFSGLVQKGINKGCSVIKNPFPTVNQSTYISNLQRSCISTDISDLKINACTPNF